MDARPVFQLTLHPTYFNQGFFNVLTDFDRYIRPDEGRVTLVLGNQFQEVEARVDRSANLNGTARVMGGARLRRWFQTHYREMDIVPVKFEALDRLLLGRSRKTSGLSDDAARERVESVTTNHQRVSEGLRALTSVLGPFVARELRKHFSDRWWHTGVLERLYENQRQGLPTGGKDDVLAASLDAARSLRLIDLWWNEIFRNELEREARTWVHVVIAMRNRWAHVGRDDMTDEDAWRALDSVIRLLEPIDATAVDPLRGLADAVRYGTKCAQASTTSAGTGDLHRSQDPVSATAWVEVRDAVLWCKHIRGNDTLRDFLAALPEGASVELLVDERRGTWEKMRNGRDGRPTAGLKPLGGARAHWQEFYREKRGTPVPIASVEQG